MTASPSTDHHGDDADGAADMASSSTPTSKSASKSNGTALALVALGLTVLTLLVVGAFVMGLRGLF